MKTAVIFGVGGQDGYYLSRLCAEQGYRVIGSSRSSGDCPGDIGDRAFVTDLIAQYRPDLIIHLAARSSTSIEALFENHRSIATGTWNVLHAAWQHCREAKIFITGSGLQFYNDGEPIHETDRFAATSPYAVERIHSVHAARYFRDRGLRSYVGYLFHHESPLRGPEHVSMKILSAAQACAEGRGDLLELGDLSVAKEWTFAGDVAAGIMTLVEQEEVFEAVIGSGQAHTIQQWVELCFNELGLSWQDHVEQSEGYLTEYARLVSNPVTIMSLGWKPKVSFTELCKMMTYRLPALRQPARQASGRATCLPQGSARLPSC